MQAYGRSSRPWWELRSRSSRVRLFCLFSRQSSQVPSSTFDFIVGNLAPAEASALAIENGEVKQTVVVDASTDLKTWESAKTVEIAVPVEGEKGFYILKSK